MFKKKPCKLSRPNKRDLTRYEAFAHAYLAVGRKSYFNAELSAIEAGYGEGYARGNAYKLVGRSGIQEAMRRLRTERAKRSMIASPEEVLEALTLQLRVLPNQLADEDGAWIPKGRPGPGNHDLMVVVHGWHERTNRRVHPEMAVFEELIRRPRKRIAP